MTFKLLLYIGVTSLLLYSCDPFNTNIEDKKITLVQYEANNIVTAPDVDSLLKIVTWNIKFGGGRIDFFFDCHGDRVLMTKTEVAQNMQGVVANIKAMNPDVILLQEADVASKRSAYFDQVQYILDNTDLNYGVYAAQWLADYVPSDGVGQVNSGNAILSKYPLDNAERLALPFIDGQPSIVKYFYLRRNVLSADLKLNNKTINILNTHTSAYSTDGTKKKQLEIIQKKVAKLDSEGKAFILGGDFNNLPPETDKYCEFDDDACEKGSGYETQACEVLVEELENMKIYSAYDAAIPQARYNLNQDIYGTFTSDKDGFWNRKLDYIFTNGAFVQNSGMVHQGISSGGVNTMPLSDHAPVSTIYKLN